MGEWKYFCPSCGGIIMVMKTINLVADFYCGSCLEDYELKVKDKIGKRL